MTDNRAGATGRLEHGLWIHPEVSDELRQWPHLFARLGLVTRQLAAHGRTSVVKSCREPNRGWLRSPLGGHGGNQYYLWWSHAPGNRDGNPWDTSAGDIVIRAVRHHDDHRPLEHGTARGYLEIRGSEDLNADITGTPWTPEQEEFATSSARVRTLTGRPGSGKTTALWHAAEAQPGEHVLYVTWSPALADEARRHFQSFATGGTTVEAVDVDTLMARCLGRDVRRETTEGSRTRFRTAVEQRARNAAGAWLRDLDALHAEIRAVVIGRAVDRPAAPGEVPLLDERSYRKERRGTPGTAARRMRDALRTAAALGPESLAGIYPELADAAAARSRTDREGSPWKGAVDLIVVDEAQDLTLLETNAILTVASEEAPEKTRLVIAADPGQTVRPTGFNWGRVTDLIQKRRFGRPEHHHLAEQVRCPTAIAATVNRAAELYRQIEKDQRPTKQRRQGDGEHVEARLIWTETATEARAAALVDSLETTPGVAFVNATETLPAWADDGERRRGVLRPSEAKGLEYQTVCVIDAGRTAVRVANAIENGSATAEVATRTRIDQLRVALSRATENLVLLEVAPDQERRRACYHLLKGKGTYFEAGDLQADLENPTAAPEELAMARIAEADRLAHQDPARGFERARQAMEIAGDGFLPNSIRDEGIRNDIEAALLRCAARTALQQGPGETQISEVMKGVAPLTSREIVWTTATATIEEVQKLVTDPERSPVLLLQTGIAFKDMTTIGTGHKSWIWETLAERRNDFHERVVRGAARPEEAPRYATETVTAWLHRLAGKPKSEAPSKEVEAEARELVRRAIRTLTVETRRLRAEGDEARGTIATAEKLLGTLAPELEWELAGALAEAADQYNHAAAHYARAKDTAARVRNLRKAGRWIEAAQESDSADEDLSWLALLASLAESRPKGLDERLAGNERRQLQRTSIALGGGEDAMRHLGTADEEEAEGGLRERVERKTRKVVRTALETTIGRLQGRQG